MLRRYAAGSSFGSGGAGRVMSRTEGDVNAESLVGLDSGEDLKEDARDPLTAFNSPHAFTFTLELLRPKRPIVQVTDGWIDGLGYCTV